MGLEVMAEGVRAGTLWILDGEFLIVGAATQNLLVPVVIVAHATPAL